MLDHRRPEQLTSPNQTTAREPGAISVTEQKQKRPIFPWSRSSMNVCFNLFQAELAEARVELASFDKSHDEKLTAARSYLELAERANNPKKMDQAWMHLYRAREELVSQYSSEKVDAKARMLRAEAGAFCEILGIWRVHLIRELIEINNHAGTTTGAPHEHPRFAEQRMRLQQAYWIRDQGLSATFFRLKILRHFQLVLVIVGLPILAIAVGLVAHYASDFANPEWKAGAIPCILAVLFGIVGALASAAQRSSRISPVTIADQLQLLSASLSRIPIGAVAGITVWLFSVAAVGDTTIHLNIADMLLAAFGAGFAERLIVQGVRAGTTEQPPR